MSTAHAMRTDILQPSEARSIAVGWFDTVSTAAVPESAQGEPSAPGERGSPSASLPTPSTAELRLAAVLQPPLTSLLDPNSVLEWPYPFHPFQRDGIEALMTRRELLLADDMGLGKTIQAIAALRILFRKGSIETALVVCPASLVAQWLRELRIWAPDLKVISIGGPAHERGIQWSLPAHVKIVSYDTLRVDVLDVRDSLVVRATWSTVVLDEASRIKNRETGITIACKRVPRDRRWALTGTPLENRTEDVESILEFLLGEHDRGPSRRFGSRPLRDLLKEVQLRRKKEQVLGDLPAKQVVEQEIELLPAQRCAYDRAEQEGIVELERAGRAVTITHVLELISRLKQICNNDPVSGESAKIADVQGRLATLVDEGHRALIFSQFTDDRFGVAHLAERLKSFSPITYTGALSAARKDQVVAEFTRDDRHKALILSLRAGGVGLNLQAASYVFHLDRWWNPAIEEQAESRAHRMGQRFPVTVFRYICVGTIEERIDAKLKAKRQLFREVVDDVSLDLAGALSEAELFGLFGLQPPKAESRMAGRTEARFDAMAGVEFEAWLVAALSRIGFEAKLTAPSRDGGIDIVATKLDELEIESRLLIQCKNTREPMSVGAVRELKGVLPERTPGVTAVAACPAGFTRDALAFARTNGILTWNRETLRQLSEQAAGERGDAVAKSSDKI